MQMGKRKGEGQKSSQRRRSSDEGQQLKIGRKWQAEARSHRKQAERHHRTADSAFLCAFPK